MAKRKPKRFDPPARDPRSRAVLECATGYGGVSVVKLECGHTVTRKLSFTPVRLICGECPNPKGGLGGGLFNR